MIRTALAVLAALALAAPALAGTPVALRAAPTATGAAVTLADVFDGASGAAGKVAVALAPAPGMNAVLDAGRVQLAAHKAGLDWANDLGVRRIVVASGTSPAGGQAGSGPRTAGRRAQVLAYARNLNAGEILQASDLRWSDEVVAGAGAPGNPDAIIGQAARRPLREGAAVQTADLAQPMVIHRDETISVAYEAGGITLVLQGKALKDAAVGESVQVLNQQSKKIIEAVAAGPGKAVVGPRADRLKAAPFSTASLR
ncbi:MAG: flagella basal body P-ring formation protein FlgA [Caulobacterales bacterium 32-69-10]|nr:MAG: flagella basal body P-ring formation protein FlgA [Caulobacterales bacterium 32-69-10]